MEGEKMLANLDSVGCFVVVVTGEAIANLESKE